jgi:hypothetical protein
VETQHTLNQIGQKVANQPGQQKTAKVTKSTIRSQTVTSRTQIVLDRRLASLSLSTVKINAKTTLIQVTGLRNPNQRKQIVTSKAGFAFLVAQSQKQFKDR